MITGLFPSKGIVFPKSDEKLPFMTRAEIERWMTPGMKGADVAELWDCLYLTQPELP